MSFSLSRRVVGLCIILAALVVSGCSILNPPPNFVPFTSDVGKFSVSLPGTPTDSPSDVDTGAGKITLHTFGIQTPQGGYYAVAYADYPDTISSTNPATVLDGVRDGAIKNTKGTLISSDKITLGSYPGIKFNFEQPDNAVTAQENAYLVGKRLYQVIVIMSKSDYSDASAQQFLSTFKVNS